MNWITQIHKYGIVRIMPIEEKPKKYKSKLNKKENIEICLNCKKEFCNGNCKDIRRNKNETKSKNN